NGMNRYFKRHGEGQYDWADLDYRGKELYDFIVEKSEEYDFKLEDTVLLGFSIGSNIAIQMILQNSETFKKAALFYPFFPADPSEKQNLSDLEVYVTLGEAEPVVPEGESKRVIELFKERDAQVTTTWVKGHNISQGAAQGASDWLKK